MSHRRQMVMALLLGALGTVGLAIAAMGQADNLAAARKWYEIEVKKITEKSTADEIYALAKGCYRNGLPDEAMTHAIEAHKKAPDDVRPKYLIFVLSGAPIEIDKDTDQDSPPGDRKGLAITEAEAEAIYKAEGEAVVRRFREIQTILVRKCGLVDCHGGGNPKSKWALVLKGPVNRLTIAENFRTVYRYMDRDKPKESTLLKKPLKGSEAGHPVQAIRGETDPLFSRIAKYIDTLKTEAEKMWEK